MAASINGPASVNGAGSTNASADAAAAGPRVLALLDVRHPQRDRALQLRDVDAPCPEQSPLISARVNDVRMPPA
eukprot:2597066-Rhodomonas_salina.1